MKLKILASAALSPVVSYVFVLIAAVVASVAFQGVAAAEAVRSAILVISLSASAAHLAMFGFAAIPALFVPAMLGLNRKKQAGRAARGLGWAASVILLSLMPTAICVVIFPGVAAGIIVGLLAGGGSVLFVYLLNRSGASEARAAQGAARIGVTATWPKASAHRAFGKRGG